MIVRSWDKEFKHEDSLPILRKLALRHCTQAGVKADSLAAAICSGDWRAICDWNIDYSGYNAAELIEIRQALGFFTKLEDLDIGIDKAATAAEKFQSAERKCSDTNEVFRSWSRGEFQFPKDVERVLFSAQRKIAKVLGLVPEFHTLNLRFGPGATSTVPKKYACARVKLSTVPSCSTNVVPLLPMFFREVPHWSALHSKHSIDEEGWLIETVQVELIDPKLSFVAKNAKTYRTVRPEPTVNGIIQGGYGEYIAKRLLSVGQDITDQERNKLLARQASLTGALATLDLSSASDLISSELVAHLLPYDWYSALSSCRTMTYCHAGEVRNLHGFSGMGNGFTFPLQTLIFWALVTSCQECGDDAAKVSVYGDDIICPVRSVPQVKRVFDSVGFVLNMEKSFWTGPFRESCGGDYLLGIDIRPYYQKKNISGKTLFNLHNFYVRSYQPEMAAMVLEHIAPSVRLFGPDGFGDGHLLGDYHRKPHKRDAGWSGFLFDTYTDIPRKHFKLMRGDSILPLYCIYVSDDEPIPIGQNTHVSSIKNGRLEQHEIAHTFPVKPQPKGYTDSGVYKDTLPGVDGYKRISIYTLTYP